MLRSRRFIRSVERCHLLDDLLDQLKDDIYFTKLDLRSGYHHIFIAKDDVWKTSSKQRKVCLIG